MRCLDPPAKGGGGGPHNSVVRHEIPTLRGFYKAQVLLHKSTASKILAPVILGGFCAAKVKFCGANNLVDFHNGEYDYEAGCRPSILHLATGDNLGS